METGFTPPDPALDTIDYYTARIMSKIARKKLRLPIKIKKFSSSILLEVYYEMCQL